MIKTPAGLPLTIALQIPTYWTPEQAFAVFELVTDLSDATAPSVQRLGDSQRRAASTDYTVFAQFLAAANSGHLPGPQARDPVAPRSLC
jgi:hypothetical protein